jgi:hypothetical protein
MNKLIKEYLHHTEHPLEDYEVMGYYSDLVGGDLIYNINLQNDYSLYSGRETIKICNDDILAFLYERTLNKED